MLTSLIITLKSPTEARLPASLGRAVQALLLEQISVRNPALAETIHAGNGPRPYTTSNLVLGKRQKGSLHIIAGQEGWLRFTGLTKEVSQHLQTLATDPPPTLTIDNHTFTVTGATLDSTIHPWAGQTSYQDLAAPYLLGNRERLPFRIRFDFVSPTTFKHKGRFMPVPLPDLLFGSLLNRWQSFAPVALHPDLRRFAAEAVVLSSYKLRSRGVPYYKPGQSSNKQKPKRGNIVGFTGQATFVALNRDRYWLNVLHLLANFAFYSGVGYQTGSGLGQCRTTSNE